MDKAATDRLTADLAALGIAPGHRIGIAVSGGADSLALLLLAHAARPGSIVAATVDHRLRAASSDEAAFVAALCATLGVPHETLVPDAPITGNLQSEARAARYARLADWAKRQRLVAVATAHHIDDQAETLLMRLQRGAGVAGLAGIRRSAQIGDLAVIRPLLGWRHAELVAIVAEADIAAIDDPGNHDDRYARAALRKTLAATPWLDPVPLANSAIALAQAEDALAWSVGRLAEQRLLRDGNGWALDPAALPEELLRRLILLALARTAAGPIPRGPEVQRLMSALTSGEVATLAGVRCSPGPRWRFAPTPPHRA